MADAVVEFLVENLKELLTYHAELIAGAQNELQMLKEALDYLKDFSRDVAKMPTKEEALRDVIREIRNVAYEVEDTIDVCLTQEAAAKSKSSLGRRLFRRQPALSEAVKSLREEVVKPIFEKVRHCRSTMVIADAPSTSDEERWTKSKREYLIRQDNVVGFEDEEQTIISYLLEEKGQLDVISITGMSGLGKTTLTWKIYMNERISYEFPVRIWINVSQKLNKRGMLTQIMKMFTSSDVSSMDEVELSEIVRSCLSREKFLLVLDDVCSLNDWKTIQNILPQSNSKGKVLITTSDNSVGVHASFRREPHKLRFLTAEESWELLQLEVFRTLTDCPQELKEIGKFIAHKCGGLPLQVVAVGGVLVDQLVKSQALGAIVKEWENVSKNVGLFLHNERSLSNVVELTYSRLPDELRDCFLYMGVFPEDYEIPSWTLIRLWIAEGFVQPKEEKSLEEIATQYLDDLIGRNLVMPSEINANREVKTCRVHDMIRMFCIYKSREQNLFQVIRTSQDGVLEPRVSELQNCRRLCVDSNVDRVLSQLPKSQKVRSFICVNKILMVSPQFQSVITDAFELLKVLESKSLRFDIISPRITRLFHLRYITLSVDHLETLPETFSNLWNLQTLVVGTRSRFITMKANIWSLMRLRHLKTNAAIVLNQKGKGEGGENLQTLNRLSPESCTEDMCERAGNLKALGIRGNLATLFKNSPLSKLGHLEKLKLLNDLVHESASENPLSVLPQHSFFPPNLKSLTLSNTFLHWKHMSTLAMFRRLEVLKLKDNAFTGIYWSAAGDCFDRLQFLLICNVDLIQWEASTSSFPRLSCLVLKNCKNLNVIPSALSNTLDRLDIERVRTSVVDSAKKIEKEKKRVQEPVKDKWRVPFRLNLGPC